MDMETTFASILDNESNSHVSTTVASDSNKATIKQGSSVASTKVYGIAHSIEQLKGLFEGKEIVFAISKKGNAIPQGFIPKELYSHLSCAEHNYFTYIPTSHARFIKKERVAGLKQILTKIGMKAKFIEANY